jgi:trehalose utilization protein
MFEYSKEIILVPVSFIKKKKRNINIEQKQHNLDGLQSSRLQVLIFWGHGSHQSHKHDHAHKAQE